jgi:hypothetical protein
VTDFKCAFYFKEMLGCRLALSRSTAQFIALIGPNFGHLLGPRDPCTRLNLQNGMRLGSDTTLPQAVFGVAVEEICSAV